MWTSKAPNGGKDPKGKGEIYGVVIRGQYFDEGYATASEEYVDSGPKRVGFTFVYMKPSEKLMIDGEDKIYLMKDRCHCFWWQACSKALYPCLVNAILKPEPKSIAGVG